MQLEKKNEQELAKRKGLTGRTIAQTIWLLLSAVVVYFIVQLLFEEQFLSYGFFYSSLAVPPWVPEWLILAALVLIGVTIMQFFFILGYVIASPEGRAPTGKPTAQAQDPDPWGDSYRR